MDKKSKILFWVIGLLIVASVSVTYWKLMIKKDYVIESQIDCDPYIEKCFVWECDPASTVEGEACTGDPENDTWYFQVAKRNASMIPLCDTENDETCDPWTCSEGEKNCNQIFCSEDLMEAQYASSCVDPVQYAIDNPVEEESECEEGDEACLAAQEESACAEDDEECLAAEEKSACEEGDEECLNAEDESADTATEGDTSGE